MGRKSSIKPGSAYASTDTIGFEAKLWLTADKLRINMAAADYKHVVLANAPFNDSNWFRKEDDVRWQFGVPPKGNANLACVQHFIHHLTPRCMAGFVLANGSMSSNQSGDCPARSAMKTPKAKPQSLPRQRDIRRALIEADLVNCIVAFPESPKRKKVPQRN